MEDQAQRTCQSRYQQLEARSSMGFTSQRTLLSTVLFLTCCWLSGCESNSNSVFSRVHVTDTSVQTEAVGDVVQLRVQGTVRNTASQDMLLSGAMGKIYGFLLILEKNEKLAVIARQNGTTLSPLKGFFLDPFDGSKRYMEKCSNFDSFVVLSAGDTLTFDEFFSVPDNYVLEDVEFRVMVLIGKRENQSDPIATEWISTKSIEGVSR